MKRKKYIWRVRYFYDGWVTEWYSSAKAANELVDDCMTFGWLHKLTKYELKEVQDD